MNFSTDIYSSRFRRPSTTSPVTIPDIPSPGVSAPLPGTACTPGQYLPDPINCASYFRCVLGELKSEQCAPGLHWHAERGFCDWPGSAKCQSGKNMQLKFVFEVQNTPRSVSQLKSSVILVNTSAIFKVLIQEIHLPKVNW